LKVCGLLCYLQYVLVGY